MKKDRRVRRVRIALLGAAVFAGLGWPVNLVAQADPATYLNDIKAGLIRQWPENRTFNLVFHGHSVPAGYFKTPVVSTLESYPWLLLEALKAWYPYAVINVINTAVGGENSASGAVRFDRDVLVHKPDLLFIDYALNDRGIGLEEAKIAWESMIRKALERNIKIILLTPSPDQNVNIRELGNELEKHAVQIRNLAQEYGIGLADSYEAFLKIPADKKLSDYMSQVNHPNKMGHLLIVQEILKWFR